MPRLSGFPPSRIPGPEGLPGLGVYLNAIRLLIDPIGQLTALARHGDVVSLAAGSPAIVCAFGAARNREGMGKIGRAHV